MEIFNSWFPKGEDQLKPSWSTQKLKPMMPTYTFHSELDRESIENNDPNMVKAVLTEIETKDV